MTTLFDNIPFFSGDPVFSLQAAFMADTQPDKVNLGIGVYIDAHGRIPLMQAVRSVLETETGQPRPYIPLEGTPEVREAIRDFVLGPGHGAVRANTAATVHTLGGTGGIALAAEFLSRFAQSRTVYLSDPTWDNHFGIFERCGFETRSYPYWDPAVRDIPFDALYTCLSGAESGSIVVVQPVCHNPTGLDLDEAQRDHFIDLMRKKEHIVVFDMAYQGFGDGPDRDASFVRVYADSGMPCFIANSFSKNMSIYGERAGGLTVVCETADRARRALSQIQLIARQLYSCPPIGGGRIVSTILTNDTLKSAWLAELDGMRARIEDTRRGFVESLASLSGDTFQFMASHRGMFSFTGLAPEAIFDLRENHAIYLLDTGRMCLAGLLEADLARVARCFSSVSAAPAIRSASVR